MIQIYEFDLLGINPYNFFIGIAYLVGFIVLTKTLNGDYCLYSKIPKLTGIIGISIIIGGIFLGYLIEVLKCVIQGNIKSLFMIKSCGFVAYGGIIGGLVSGYLYSKYAKIDTEKVMDSLACVFPISHSIARMGCFFSGCCYGFEYYGIFSVKYWNKTFCCFPWQLSEATLDLILGIILYRIVSQKKYHGKCVWIYLGVYAFYRFCLEFIRGDELRGIWGVFSTSQYISILLILFIIIKLKYSNVRHKII